MRGSLIFFGTRHGRFQNNLTVNKILSSLRKEFNFKKDIRKSGKYKPDMNDFQRLDIGDYSSSSRFARFFFKFEITKLVT